MDANELSNSSCDGSLAFTVGRKAALVGRAAFGQKPTPGDVAAQGRFEPCAPR